MARIGRCLLSIVSATHKEISMTRQLTWATFHRWEFNQPLDAADFSIKAPLGARLWLCGPDSPQGDNGLRTRVSTVWGGTAFYEGEAAAYKVIDDPLQAFCTLPPLVEHWHTLLLPIRHRGETNWFTLADSALCLSSTDPGGAIAVVTSGGFNSRAPDQVPRIARFSEKVDQVREWFSTLESNVVTGNYGPTMDGADGMTFSLWKSEQSLVEAAYQPGFHRERIDEQKIPSLVWSDIIHTSESVTVVWHMGRIWSLGSVSRVLTQRIEAKMQSNKASHS